MKRIRIAATLALAGTATAITLVVSAGSAGATRLPGVAEPLPNPWHPVVVAEPLPNPWRLIAIG